MHCFAFPNKILLSLFLMAMLGIVSCEKEVVGIAETFDVYEDDYIQPAVEQFIEPSDLNITYQKARNFNKASEGLVIMGQEWAEKMSQVDDEEKLKMAAVYEKVQDDLIRKFGIMGKEEFKWIQTVALPEPTNYDVFARAGIWIKQ